MQPNKIVSKSLNYKGLLVQFVIQLFRYILHT